MILLSGGTGFTGSLLAKALIERGASLRLIGRSQHRLEKLAEKLKGDVELVVADMGVPAALQKAMEGVSVAVSAVGPYQQIGEPFFKAALTTRTPYVDICAEQFFLRDMYERFESKVRRAGIPVVMGMGVAPALADWAANICSEGLVRPAITINHALEKYRPSRGIRQTAMAQMAHPIEIWEQDRWEPVTFSQLTGTTVFPSPYGQRETSCFPAGAVMTIPRHVDAERVIGYLALVGDASFARWFSLATSALTPALPALLNSPVGAFLSAESGRDLPFPPVANHESKFAVLVQASTKNQATQMAVLGADPYETTAQIAAAATIHIAEHPAALRPGCLLYTSPSPRDATLSRMPSSA